MGGFRKRSGSTWRGFRRWRLRRSAGVSTPTPVEPIDLAVTTLELALEDDSTMVRTEAVAALGQIGPAAATVTPKLIALSKVGEESLRCQVARSLGEVGGDVEATVAALVDLLGDANPEVKAIAARALGALKTLAAPAVQAIASLLQDREESVRTAAAEAIAQVGPLDQAATEKLVEGLASQDTVVRAQTAQALGTIGAAAEDAAPLWSRRWKTRMTGYALRRSRRLARSVKPQRRPPCLVSCTPLKMKTIQSARWPLKPWARWETPLIKRFRLWLTP